MISILVLVSASALVGAAAGRWAMTRGRATRPAEPAEPAATATSAPRGERGPIALGDVIVLDEGRGQELWVARELALCEGDDPAWLTLFEADGPASARAILAWDPADAGSFALLRPAPTVGLSLIPSTLEVEGAPLSLTARRTSKAVLSAAPSAEGQSDLAPQGEVLVATYRGGARGFAVVARSHDRTRLYAGQSMSLHEVSVLQVDRPT